MKKLLIFVLLALCVFVTPIVAAEKADLIGEWFLNGFSMDGENWINPANIGLQAEITLNEDGTLTATFMEAGAEAPNPDDTDKGTWEANAEGALLTMSGQAQQFKFENECLTYDGGEDGIMRFSREKPEPPFKPADPAKDTKAEDYEGTWKAVMIGMDGNYLDWNLVASELGFETNEVTIKDGVLKAFGEENESTKLTFEDGSMVFRNEEEFMKILDVTATLREDGIMTLDYMMMTFVLEKAEEQ